MPLRIMTACAVLLALLLGHGEAVAYDGRFDYNDDGRVDEQDVAMIRAAFNTSEGDAAFDPSFDHDGDGIVSGTDIVETLKSAHANSE